MKIRELVRQNNIAAFFSFVYSSPSPSSSGISSNFFRFTSISLFYVYNYGWNGGWGRKKHPIYWIGLTTLNRQILFINVWGKKKKKARKEASEGVMEETLRGAEETFGSSRMLVSYAKFNELRVIFLRDSRSN